MALLKAETDVHHIHEQRIVGRQQEEDLWVGGQGIEMDIMSVHTFGFWELLL
jgi:hypothetical protein